MICYFDNCICHQNCYCDVVLRDDARLVPCGSHLWAMQPQQQLKFTLTKILATDKLIGHFNYTVVTL